MAEPGLDRRAFLRIGLAAGPMAAAAACGWDGGPLLRPRLGAISRLNDWVGEQILSTRRLAPEYSPALRTGRNFPSYFISDRVPVVPEPAEWALEVGGEVRRPMRFSLDRLRSLPAVTYTVKHHCVEGWTAVATWSGVPLATIAAAVQPTDQARYLRFDSFDQGYFNGWDLKSALHPQTIVAIGYNDRPLMPNHGAPARIYSPIKLGYKLTKYLTRISFTARRPGGYWEDQGYPWFAGV